MNKLAAVYFRLLPIAHYYSFYSASAGLHQNITADNVDYYKSINKIFAGWDYGLYKEKAARVKKSLIRHEIMVGVQSSLTELLTL